MFYLIKVYVLAELWMFFYLVWYFFAKKGHFQPNSCAEAILLSSMWLEDCLTKVKSSKIITFCYFWPNMGKNLVLIPSKTVFLANLVFKFHPGISITTTSCFQIYTSCNIWKKSYWNVSFFAFFTILDLIWPKFCPKGHTYFPFFDDFQWNMLGDSVNINKLCLKKKKKNW